MTGGLKYLDYGARMQDAKLGRWFNLDNLAEKYCSFSPFNYALNNPVRIIDIGGLFPRTIGASHHMTFAFEQISYNVSRSHRLNTKVKQLVFGIHNPGVAFAMGIRGAQSKDSRIAKTATNFELNLARRSGVLGIITGSPGDEGNAIRHGIWQAITANRFGESIAEQVGWTHEEQPLTDLSLRVFSTLHAADQVIGLLNNEIGRAIGLSNPGASSKELVAELLGHFHHMECGQQP